MQVDAIRDSLANDEQKVGADIVKRALGYPLKLIANNAGVNGSVVMQKVLDSGDDRLGYNAAIGERTDVAVPPEEVYSCSNDGPFRRITSCSHKSQTQHNIQHATQCCHDGGHEPRPCMLGLSGASMGGCGSNVCQGL